MIYELQNLHRKTRHARRHRQGGEHGVARDPRRQFRQARRLLVHRDRAAQPGHAHVELRDYDERTKLRAELAKNPRWTGEYMPLIRPLLVRQDVRLLNAIRPPVAPATTGNVYELRNYRAKPAGAAKQWLDAFTAVLPAREKYSKIVGLWQTEAGQPNEVCHIWAYPEPERRAEAARQRDEGSGLAGISRQGSAVPRRDALDHHAAGAALAAEVRLPRDGRRTVGARARGSLKRRWRDDVSDAPRSRTASLRSDAAARRGSAATIGSCAPQRDQHVADRKAAAPDRVDHGMIGACGGIGQCDRRIGAEMPGQIQRQLHAG